MVRFVNGYLYSSTAPTGIPVTLSIFKEIQEYFNSFCVVTHWVNGGYAKSRMKVKDAVYQINEEWLEKASFELED